MIGELESDTKRTLMSDCRRVTVLKREEKETGNSAATEDLEPLKNLLEEVGDSENDALPKESDVCDAKRDEETEKGNFFAECDVSLSTSTSKAFVIRGIYRKCRRCRSTERGSRTGGGGFTHPENPGLLAEADRA